MESLCRACLSTNETYKYFILDNVSTKLYWYCTSIEVDENDVLPKSLCDNCYELLTKYSDFKKTCIMSQSVLNGQNCMETDVEKFLIQSHDICQETKYEFENELDSKSQVNLLHSPEKINDNCEDNLSENGVDDFEFSQKAKPTIVKFKKRLKKLKIKCIKSNLKEKKKVEKYRKFIYSCEYCNKKFKYLDRFEAHKLEHEGKDALIHCTVCNKSYMTWSGLRRHNETEHTLVSLETLKCNICGKICKSTHTLGMHRKTHGERKLHVCDVCGKGFSTEFTLRGHQETHKENREKLYTCEHCGKKFYTNAILLKHVNRRHTERKYVCHVCSYPFKDKHYLSKHLSLHEGLKPHKCDICIKSFATHSSLVEHKRTHTGERPYMCSYCPKSFLSKRRLTDHHRIHTGEKPHKCSICDMRFVQRGTLNRHMKVHERSIPVIT